MYVDVTMYAQVCLLCSHLIVRKECTRHCERCGARLALPRQEPSPRGSAHRVLVRDRLRELAGVDAVASSKFVEALRSQFARFLEDDGGTGDLREATPSDVVAFLITRDERGRTRVHVEGCPAWGRSGTDVQEGCACAKRAGAGSVRTVNGRLQGVFRDMGYVSPWDTMHATGNPCDSAEVRRYLDAVQREQLRGGVSVMQAPLASPFVVQQLLRTVLREHRKRRRASDNVRAYEAIRDACLYSLLWVTGLRAEDARKVTLAHLERFRAENALRSPAGDKWVIHVGLTKSQRRPDQARRVQVSPEPPDSVLCGWSFQEIMILYHAELLRLHLPGAGGHLFRNVRMSRHQVVWDVVPGRPAMARAFEAWRQAARLPPFTLHSFHGGRAAHLLKGGMSAAAVSAAMAWTPAMLEHYTTDRVPISAEDVRKYRTSGMEG